MITIKPNANWRKFEKLFSSTIMKRYDWFLFEFGKRITSWINDELLGNLDEIKGSDEYKKRLVIAEVRTKDRAWFAIAAKAVSVTKLNEQSKSQILKVVRRFEIEEGRDPIKEILVDYGPWTEESIPFAPSLRQAMVVVQDVDQETYDRVLAKNHGELPLYAKLMSDFKINTHTRLEVRKSLRAVKDLTIQALQMEYRKTADGKPHWRPAIKKSKTEGVKKLMTDRELIRSITDVNFMKWKSRKHLRIKLTASEYKQFEKFQREIIKGL